MNLFTSAEPNIKYTIDRIQLSYEFSKYTLNITYILV